MDRFALVMLGLLALAGCSENRGVAPAAPAADLDAFPVAGPWATGAAGLRMQIRVNTTITEETGTVNAVLVVQNAGPAAISLRPGETNAPMVVWRADRHVVNETHVSENVNLAPGQEWVSTWVETPMPPGANHRTLHADLVAKGQACSAMMPITLTPTEWGPPSNGLRLRVACNKQVYAVGEKPVIRLFAHNLTDKPLQVHPVDFASLELKHTRENLSFSFQTIDEAVSEVGPGEMVAARLPEPLLLAPGRYRLRVWVTSAELGIEHPIAWFGQLQSNELEIEVK